MKRLVTYLMFNGNCREAMTAYQAALGGELSLSTYGESQQGSPEDAHLVLHANLNLGPYALMASDAVPEKPSQVGENFSLTVDCDSTEEQDRLFAALGDEATVTMPLQDTFWGARFGMLRDQFGVGWMLNYDKPQP